jgi:hypothetical protein
LAASLLKGVSCKQELTEVRNSDTGVSTAAMGDDGRFGSSQFRRYLTSGHAGLDPRRDLLLGVDAPEKLGGNPR